MFVMLIIISCWDLFFDMDYLGFMATFDPRMARQGGGCCVKSQSAPVVSEINSGDLMTLTYLDFSSC